MKTGLVLGKFAPLHRGHQLLIERALSENDRTLVLVYDSPKVTSIRLEKRCNWIRSLYPSAHVIEAWNGPSEVGDSPEIMRRHEQYILQTLAGETVDRFYSSEFYGEHVSAALGAEDCRVDQDRVRYPVSGSAIRENPFEYREFISPIVYRDLIKKVVFLGAPSTGKTTLVEQLAKKLNTSWMPEYGREYWEKHQKNRRLTKHQLVEIAEEHRRREDRFILDANQIFFVDTEAVTTLAFSMYYHGEADNDLKVLANHSKERYDLFFLCDDDIPFDDTWDRSGVVSRKKMQQIIVRELSTRQITFDVLSGSIEKRIASVCAKLAVNPAPS
ncbi:AAA family ATPase [Calycomorphotria hydatis]|uniref:Trifunctional NAD biosynthesis/regulator protein NadR n=1 Tax=Calycomorphotria hydatis TaxID=2528027 RepID=A0A517T940_9PLAN|nr:AAA family ATPase [Calycomorphotria hydatis]QDT64886.1 Trifunctional NAD biosynthesis/regulator protein NadR [Calycomorphotria hydatis]